MRRIIGATLLAVVIFAGSAAATSTRFFYLLRGDVAVTQSGDVTCETISQGGAPAFRCKVGGDYRARYGVIIGSFEVDVTRYTGFRTYRIIERKKQTPVAP